MVRFWGAKLVAQEVDIAYREGDALRGLRINDIDSRLLKSALGSAADLMTETPRTILGTRNALHNLGT